MQTQTRKKCTIISFLESNKTFSFCLKEQIDLVEKGEILKTNLEAAKAANLEMSQYLNF